MAIAHVRKGDTVVVVAGKERGKRGRVLRVIPDKNRVVVERINMIKKHQRPTQKLRQGGIIEREGAIHLSNVMLVDPTSDKPTRIGMRELGDGKKVRVARKSGEIIDKA
jgi:large subunit ribosomal protein L24